MKYSSVLVAVIATLASATPVIPRTSSEQTFRLMSYNFRYDNMPDAITVQQTIDGLSQGLPAKPSTFYSNTAEKPWSTRRIGIANDILFPQTHILGSFASQSESKIADNSTGVQEAFKRQVEDIQLLLGSEWDHVGAGRDDGKEAGEYEAIFYQKSVLVPSSCLLLGNLLTLCKGRNETCHLGYFLALQQSFRAFQIP